MFKPSLKRNILNNKLCVVTQNDTNPFSFVSPDMKTYEGPKLIRPSLIGGDPPQIGSLMIPEYFLNQKTVRNNKQYTHVFTPLSYDYIAYPSQIKQRIQKNPNAAKCGKISNQIKYVIFEKTLMIWKNVHQVQQKEQSITLKIHIFEQNLDVLEASIMNNLSLFRWKKVIVVAIAFNNNIKFFKLDEDNLSIDSLMIRYKIRSCNYIQKISFTKHNQVIFCGDNGQLIMISFSGEFKQFVMNAKLNILQKYLSPSSLNYSVRYLTREITITESHQNFVYVLSDRVWKSSYLIYLSKKCMNQIIRLKEEPKYIHEQSYIDIYKIQDQNGRRTSIVHVDRILQQNIRKRMQDNYGIQWNQTLKQGYRIVSFHAQYDKLKQDSSLSLSNNQVCEINEDNIRKNSSEYLNSPTLTLTTKCGYKISLIHKTISMEQPEVGKEGENFLFLSPPKIIPKFIYGETSLFQGRSLIIDPQQNNQNQNSYIVKSLGKDNITLFSNILAFEDCSRLSLLKISDLKRTIYQNIPQEQKENEVSFISYDQFYQNYNFGIIKPEDQQQKNSYSNNKGFGAIFGAKLLTQNLKLYNIQRKWTVFDNNGEFNIYLLELRHILLIYLFYRLEYSTQQNAQFLDTNSYYSSQSINFDTDLKFNSILEKITQVYGYTAFIKALIQIITLNSGSEKEYFYLQRQLFFEIVKKQFELYEFPTKFEEWRYGLYQNSKAFKMAASKKIINYVWILLIQYEFKNVLSTQKISVELTQSEYFSIFNKYSEAFQKPTFSAYGNALQQVFFESIKPIIYIKARQFQKKQELIVKCQQKLISLENFLQTKYLKENSIEYKSYIHKKLKNSEHPQSANITKQDGKFVNSITSTHLSTNSLSELSAHDQLAHTDLALMQAKGNMQRSLLSGIKKIVLTLNVMKLLSEKDLRTNLPNLIEILTNFKSQVKIGQEFFKQELILSQNNGVSQVQYVHPQFIKLMELNIPEFKLKNKLDYVNFKMSRNLLKMDENEQDLKSLNLKGLAKIVCSSQLEELRKIFLNQNNFDEKKYSFYIEFLCVCMVGQIQQINMLSEQKNNHFENMMKSTKGSVYNSIKFLSVEQLILSQQKLDYVEQELQKFYTELQFVFVDFLDNAHKITGQRYYQTERYMDSIIEMLAQNFGCEEVLIQFLETQLKKRDYIQKLMFLKRIVQISSRKYIEYNIHPIPMIKKQYRIINMQTSTLEYFMKQGSKKLTQDTKDTKQTKQGYF